MKKSLICSLSILLSGAALAVPRQALEFTEPRTYVGANGKIFRYRWHQPAQIEAGKRYPLVFLLHGAGERGTNNVSQLAYGVAEILSYAAKNGDCFLVAGQVPDGLRWVETDWSATRHAMPVEPSQTMALQIEFGAKVMKELPIDADRIYATGISMGGYGTWDLVSRRPEWFAAAMPICGGMDLRQAWKIRDVAIWTHHGDKDDTVPFVRSRLATEALWRVGGNVKYTEHPNCGHGSWFPAYANVENIKWLFAQRKLHRPRIPFANGDKIAFLGDSITYLGTTNSFGYVNLVMKGLAARGLRATAIPAGISGNRSDHMLARLDRDVLSKSPNWMFLSCGVNDPPNGFTDYRKNPSITLEAYRANITAIVTRATAAGVKVIMLEPTPVVEEPHVANVNEAPYLEAFRTIARERNLPLVPINTVITGYLSVKEDPFVRELTVDGTHLNPLGNRIYAETVLSSLGW